MAHAVHDLNACQLLLVHRRLHPHHFQQIHHCLLLARCHYHHWHLSFLGFFLFFYFWVSGLRDIIVITINPMFCHLLLDMPYK